MESLLENLQARAAGHPPSLPLKLLIVADCAGKDAPQSPVAIGSGGVSELLERLRPQLAINSENKLQKNGPKIQASLEIRSLEDFHPAELIQKIPALSEAAAAEHPGLGDQLDEILHAREFQRMEACWRSLERLSRDICAKPGIHVEILAANRKNLKNNFHSQVFEPEYQGTTSIPLSAIFFDFQFSHEPADLPLLESLADDCEILQAPMIAGVSPAFFQLKNLAHLPNLPDIAAKLQLPAYAGWRRFQTSSKSRWVCLTANRYLARETYTLRKENGASLEYTEKAGAANPERYLWAEAGWLVLSNLGRSFSKFRHCVVIDGMGPETAHNNLPVRPFPKMANVEVPSPTEILIDDSKAWDIVRGGVTMLVGISDGAVATFPLIATVYRLRPGAITTESPLSYQLFAGNLSHYLMTIYGEIPAEEGSPAMIGFLRDRMHEFLLPFSGEKPEDTVQVEVVEAAGEGTRRSVKILLKPSLKMQGKDVDFTLQVNL